MLLISCALTLLPIVFAAKSSQYKKLTVSRAANASGSVETSLGFQVQWLNGQGGYFAEIGVGTPAQSFQVLIDTGSSNLFVPAASAPACENYTCPGGVFDQTASTSFSTPTAPEFKIGYADGSLVTGAYAQDVLTLGDASLTNFTFGLATSIQVSPGTPNGAQYGILGISFDGEEAAICPNQDCSKSYVIPTINDALYSAGYTGSKSFSLYLDDVQEQKGSLLFGAIDTAKYSGDLVTLATVKHSGPSGDPQDGQYVEQGLYVTDGTVTINGTTTQLAGSNFSNPVVLDSGAAGMSLPASMFKNLEKVFPNDLLVQSEDAPLAMYCDQYDYSLALTVTLTGADGKTASIDVPLREFLVPIYNTSEGNGGYNSTTVLENDGRAICRINIGSGDDGEQLLFGDPLLRSAYVFYNLDEKTISIAQPSFSPDQENIVPVGQGPTPSLQGTGTASIVGANVTIPESPTGSSTPPATETTTPPASYTGAAAGNRLETSMIGSLQIGITVFIAMWSALFYLL